MKNERCLSDQTHSWVCRQVGGAAGEIVNERLLTGNEVDLVKKDDKQSEAVCSQGVIICKRCEDTLVGVPSGNRITFIKDLVSGLEE